MTRLSAIEVAMVAMTWSYIPLHPVVLALVLVMVLVAAAVVVWWR